MIIYKTNKFQKEKEEMFLSHVGDDKRCQCVITSVMIAVQHIANVLVIFLVQRSG